ncbi:MAG TPA: HDOD domain-containing protein [Steroidobacteraceae bacterium]
MSDLSGALLIVALAVLAGAVGGLLLAARRRPVAARPEFSRHPVPAAAPAPPPSVPAAASPAPPAAAVATQLHELAFGVAQRPASADPQHRAVATAVTALLSEPVLNAEYAPRRPLLLPKLVQAVNDDDVSGRELSRLIAKDPALAGNLLRMANSAFYRVNSQPVESIDRAVALLGTAGIRSLIAASLMQPVFKASTVHFKRFPDVTWLHTQYGATAAEAYAALVADSDPFAGQLLGLLMGLGTIMVFRATTDEYAKTSLVPDAGTVAELVAHQAPDVARRIAQDWELSERILSALAEQVPAVAAGDLTALGASLRFGRYCGAIAVLQGVGVLDEDRGLAALRAGGYGRPDCERILVRLAKRPTA